MDQNTAMAAVAIAKGIPGTAANRAEAAAAQAEAVAESIPQDYTALSNNVDGLQSAVSTDLYIHATDTDAFYWQPKTRVNSVGSAYATGNDYIKYAGIKKTSSAYLTVYPGSKIVANTGYTLDYSLKQDGVKKQFARDVAAGTVVTIEYMGILYLSVTDGVTDASTEEEAKAVAKAGLTIDLLIAPIKSIVEQNASDIAAMKPELKQDTESLEYGEPFVGYVTGYDIITGINEGETVDVSNPVQSATMCYGIIPCVTGDKFVVTGTGLSDPRAWAFTDGNYKLLKKSASQITVTDLVLYAEADGYLIVNAINTRTYYTYKKIFNKTIADDVYELKKQSVQRQNDSNHTKLVSAQKSIAEDWHFGFVDVADGMGLGSNHLIPGTATIWSQSGTTDLNQKGIWMSDGIHPFRGTGVTDMYARTIAEQLAMIPPSYHDGVGVTTPTLWNGRTILWMGTSIPAGSDPEAGEGTGFTYPALVSQILGATSVNRARGASCVRINASTGEYNGMVFNHFARALSRTVDEVDLIAADWDNIKGKIGASPNTLSEANISTMKAHSFENLLLPYLDGTNTMPDLFVFDHGHNDVRPKGIDGQNDLWITPSSKMIADGILAEDTYMVENDYAHLKLALNDDLSGIEDVAGFAATLNRNCFKGAVNFIITLILRYNPYARIVIISDYN